MMMMMMMMMMMVTEINDSKEVAIEWLQPRYLHQGGRCAVGSVCLSVWLCLSVCLFVCLSVCLSVCVQDYCKSNQLIPLKLGVMIGPTSCKNWLTFGGDPDPDIDSRSLFHFPHHCRIGDYWRFISISHTVTFTGQFLRHSAKWLMLTR